MLYLFFYNFFVNVEMFKKRIKVPLRLWLNTSFFITNRETVAFRQLFGEG